MRAFGIWARGAAVVLGLAIASSAAAQDAARIARMQAAFDGWLEAHDTKGVAALAYRGAPAGVLDGGMDPDQPVELASVGKSITAICTKVLFDEELLNYGDSPQSILGTGPAIPVSQLLTPAGGLVEDVTRAAMIEWLGGPDHRGFRDRRMLRQTLFNLTGRETVAGDVNHVVGAGHDEYISIFINDPRI